MASLHQSFLAYRRFRYLKWAVMLVVLVVVIYAVHEPRAARVSGDSWLGCTLGTLGAVIIAGLTALGVRKRLYRVGPWPLSGWLSVHLYMGAARLVVVSLHTGYEVALNVHWFAYWLVLSVIASGAYEVVAYTRYPDRMVRNRTGVTMDELMHRISDIDNECRAATIRLD
ncbi:MAG: hypothetical protein ACI9W2_002956, partial [Gammaproteobacteria bacterium]